MDCEQYRGMSESVVIYNQIIGVRTDIAKEGNEQLAIGSRDKEQSERVAKKRKV